jgi:serine/threonine protein kinase
MFTHRSGPDGNASSNRETVTPPQIPDHELIRRIGGGSYGEVWLARNILGGWRAVKIIYRSSFDHDRPFEREFEGIQKFEPISRLHESQVNILHVGRRDAYFYYVMDLADEAEPRPNGTGEQARKGASERIEAEIQPESYVPRTLKFELHEHGRLPVEQCIEIGLALTTALRHLHEHALVHRDVKPSNIIFVGGLPKLADIGLVATMDRTMSFVGTSGFLPPEGPGTPQGDIYSLGKVLYEISMGRDRQEFPKLPSDLAEFEDATRLLELNAVILKACHRDPRQRYQSAQQLAADLQLLQGGKSIRHYRSVQRRWSVGKRAALVCIALATLVYAIALTKSSKGGKIPNPEAQRLYELGRWHHQQLTDDSLKKAIAYLNKAIEIDPGYAEPHAALFQIYFWGVQGVSEKEKNEKVRQIAGKLLSLAPNLAAGHVALSWSKYCDGDWAGAEHEIQRALRLDPNYATAHGVYCYYLSMLDRVEEARVHGKRAQELDPTSRIEATLAGFPLVTAHHYHEAIAQFRRALELDQHFALAHLWIAKCYEALSNYPAAIQEFQARDLMSGEDSVKVAQRYEALRRALDDSGEKGYWLKLLEIAQAEEQVPVEQKRVTDTDRWFVPGIYARLGEKAKALDLLEKDFEQSGGNDWLQFEPIFDGLRDEPRFIALVKKAGLQK